MDAHSNMGVLRQPDNCSDAYKKTKIGENSKDGIYINWKHFVSLNKTHGTGVIYLRMIQGQN
jgi:hypothetical protein